MMSQVDGSTSEKELTILYAEDDPYNRDVLVKVARRLPGRVRVVTAKTGTEALSLAASESPDLVLLDLDLPDMKGKVLLERLRSGVITDDVPAIVISAHYCASTIATMRKAGVREFVSKPVDVGAVLAILTSALDESRNRVEVAR